MRASKGTIAGTDVNGVSSAPTPPEIVRWASVSSSCRAGKSTAFVSRGATQPEAIMDQSRETGRILAGFASDTEPELTGIQSATYDARERLSKRSAGPTRSFGAHARPSGPRH